MAPSLMGKVAVVTGSSRGVGRAVAERVAQDGATVVVNHAHSAGAAQEVVSGIEARGGQAIVVQADMSKAMDIRHLLREVMIASAD